MTLLSTSDQAFMQSIHDALHNIDETTGFGEITVRFTIRAKRIVGGEVLSAPTIARGIASTENSVVRQLHR